MKKENKENTENENVSFAGTTENFMYVTDSTCDMCIKYDYVETPIAGSLEPEDKTINQKKYINNNGIQ